MVEPEDIKNHHWYEETYTAEWTKLDGDEQHTLTLTVHDNEGNPVIVYLSQRPHYCDRGHFKVIIDGNLNLDAADSFPRYFFSLREANNHVRNFLRWRLWKVRQNYENLKDLKPKY